MITERPRTTPSLAMTRRKILGCLLLRAGALLTGCRLTSLGKRMSYKGKVLLDRIPYFTPGLRDAVQFPLIEALFGRRARRFSLGASVANGPFAFTSPHIPLPLSELEQMIVLTAVAGNTGWHFLIPHNPRYLPHIPNYACAAGARTFPSAAGFHTSEFFFTVDNGVYFFPTRDTPCLIERDREGMMDTNAYLSAHRSRTPSTRTNACTWHNTSRCTTRSA